MNATLTPTSLQEARHYSWVYPAIVGTVTSRSTRAGKAFGAAEQHRGSMDAVVGFSTMVDVISTDFQRGEVRVLF